MNTSKRAKWAQGGRISRVRILSIALGVSLISQTVVAGNDGATLYQRYCAACHGVNLEGEANWRQHKADGNLPAPPHDDSGHTWHHPDELLFNYVKYGGQKALQMLGATWAKPSPMPGFSAQMNDEQIWQVLNYIKSHWSEPARQRQQSITQQSQK